MVGGGRDCLESKRMALQEGGVAHAKGLVRTMDHFNIKDVVVVILNPK